jgi:DNA-binding MarR family transcriptional regulator
VCQQGRADPAAGARRRDIQRRYQKSKHSGVEELVKALQRDKGTISRSLRTLEARGWLIIGRSLGGKAQHLTLTPEGHKRAGKVAKSWH